MRRTVPLIITTVVGFVMIVAYFIPQTEDWGEIAGICFDVLAAIAFILGGGNLLKMHLKKISDGAPGRGYSAITIVSFLFMLAAGLLKWGSPPAPQQEFYGEVFAPLSLEQFPEVYAVSGQIPDKPTGQKINASVRRQIRQVDDTVQFVGWMSVRQREDLRKFKRSNEWHDTVDELFAAAQPPEDMEGRVSYYADRGKIGFRGHMTDELRGTLDGFSEETAWTNAVAKMYTDTQQIHRVDVDPGHVPPGFDEQRARQVSESIEFDSGTGRLQIQGPMSVSQRDQLIDQFPRAYPLSTATRDALSDQLQQLGQLSSEQHLAMDVFFETQPTVESLVAIVDPDEQFNEEQIAAIELWSEEAQGDVEQLIDAVQEAGTLSEPQQQLIRQFVDGLPWVAEQRKDLFLALLDEGPVDPQQRAFLLDDFRSLLAWRDSVWQLFQDAHIVKYPWSGSYVAEGSIFWWMYEYAFKPLTATMFAMLAFYVASAAFRAFRAKNFAAILLLATAFIILLGRTFAGVLATSWLPETGILSYLRIENISITIMSVFTTAGNRAIMIGIALGTVSASLKVLLGIDRSYLGSGEE